MFFLMQFKTLKIILISVYFGLPDQSEYLGLPDRFVYLGLPNQSVYLGLPDETASLYFWTKFLQPR